MFSNNSLLNLFLTFASIYYNNVLNFSNVSIADHQVAIALLEIGNPEVKKKKK